MITSRSRTSSPTRKPATMIGADILPDAITVFPYKLQPALTDSGMSSTAGPGPSMLMPTRARLVCREHGIEHRLTKWYHP